jgi:hypothetical protein
VARLGAAEIVRVEFAVAPAGAVRVPLAGVTDSPCCAVAAQVTVAGSDVPRVLSSSALTVVDEPGDSRTWPGLTSNAARVLGGNWTGPAPNEGGASSAAVPQWVSGEADSVKSRWRVRPRSIQVCWVGRPSAVRPVTYGLPAPLASIVRSPSAPWMTARGNCGAPSTTMGTPGVCGYTPSAAHTYQELIAPRSSLPGSPPGAVEYSWLVISWTTCCVRQGAPALSYTQGVSSAGSLPCQWYGSLGPAFSWVK